MACRNQDLFVHGRPWLLTSIAGWIATIVVAVGCVPSAHPSPPQPAVRNRDGARALFCAYGGVGLTPREPPRDFVRHSAVAVVEISSRRRITDVKVTEFTLFDRNDRLTTFTRVVAIEGFLNRSRRASEGPFAYYLNPAGAPWDGTLPAGTIRLRVHVALAEEPTDLVRFRVSLGPFVVEGPVDGEWPTG
jgi:hypothetical protein